MYWTDSFFEINSRAEKGQLTETTSMVKSKLNYVRDLSKAPLSHEWKALTLARGKKFVCADGIVFARITPSKEIHIVIVSANDPIVNMLDELAECKLPTWGIAFAEMKSWQVAA